MIATQPQLQWVTPSPMWKDAGADPGTMRKPALLSFASDHFVDELKEIVAQDPVALPIAAWESARLPPAGTLDPANWKPARGNRALKLFQPIHGRFYMVAASLVCRQVGLPDHALRVANQERTYFVLRRIGTDAQGNPREMGWVPDPSAPTDRTRRVWKALPDQTQRPSLDPDEELMPLFPVFIPKTATRPARRLHAGLIPTSSRETRASAAVAPSSSPSPSVLETRQRVLGPYAEILAARTNILENHLPANNPPEDVAEDPALPLLAQASALLMLDLADVLQKYVPDVFAAIVNGSSQLSNAQSAKLQGDLAGAIADPTLSLSWAGAIKAAWEARDLLNNPPLSDPANPSPPPTSFNLFYATTPLDPTFGDHLEAAIQAQNIAPDPPDQGAALAAIVPKFDGNALYVVRCVFQRCAQKRQQLGVLHPAVLSDPSDPFEIAPFFDTDAPARTIRIPMPIDTSPSGLRKFPKSVGFLLSDKLQKQICQASDFASLLKGNLGNCSDLQLGQICSFSIPIITIIAMMLMMIMAILLNFVFWWLPFLKICFPIPISAPTEPEEA